MKRFVGKVVATGMNKSIVVEVSWHKKHPLYKKIVTRQRRYLVDSASHTVSIGDVMEIVETRPVSKHKHFAIDKIITSSTNKEEKNGTA